MRYRVLGPLQIESDEGTVLPVNAHRQRSVVAMLLIARGQSITADRLIDAIWGDDLPANPANTLQNSIAQLRKTFEPDRARSEAPTTLVSTPAGYRLELDGHTVDAADFEAGLERARGFLGAGHGRAALDEITDALDLWRGDPYVDFIDDEFAVAERERLSERHMEAIEMSLDARSLVDGPEAVIAELEALVTDHPHREALWGRLMTALYQAGRQAEALRTYQRATTTLGEELGIDASPELQELEERILLQDPSLARSTAGETQHNIPAPVGTLIGREKELAEVAAALAEHRVVTLLGPGGSGKTRLALEVAWNLTTESHGFEDGIWLVRLDDLTDADLVESAIGGAIGMPESAESTVRQTLIAHLRTRRMLLVLDNCEHILAHVTELITELLAGCPSLTVLATSQKRMSLTDEQRIHVPPLALPSEAAGPFADLSDAPSVELFINRALHFDPDQSFNEADLGAIANIVSGLDGMPLAIELAAARTTTLSPAEIARLMADRFDLLSTGRANAPDRQRSLRGAVEWSYNLLSSDDQDLFIRLSTCVGGFELGAAAALSGSSEATVANGLHRLIGSSLLTRLVGEDGSTRYRMIESLRQYGTELLAADSERRVETQSRHAGYYAARAADLELKLMGPDQSTAYRAIVADEDNFRAAMAYGLESSEHLADGVGIASSLGRFWDLSGSLSEGHRWLSSYVDAVGDSTDIHGLAFLIAWHAFFVSELGDRSQAAELSLGALPYAVRDGTRTAESAIHGAASMWARLRGETELALEYAQTSLEIAATANEPWYIALAHNNATHAHIASGDTASARATAERGLSVARDVGDQRVVGWMVATIAQIDLLDGRADDALTTALEAIDVSTNAFDGRNAAWASSLAAEAARVLGDDEQAAKLEASASSLLADRGMPVKPWEYSS